MNLSQRIEAFAKLGEFFKQFSTLKMEKSEILKKIQLKYEEIRLNSNNNKKVKLQNELEVLKIKLEIQNLKDRLAKKLKMR